MIQSLPQPNPGRHPRGILASAGRDLAGLPKALEILLESLSDRELEEVRPQLQEVIQSLLTATRAIADAAVRLPPPEDQALLNEVREAERTLSGRLLDFRQALGSGSTDTIRISVRRDLLETAKRWTNLLDAVLERLPDMNE